MTIPAAIAAAAGIHTGSKFDVEWANGVITLRPLHHDDERESMLAYSGIGASLWGDSQEEIDVQIGRERSTWDR